MTEPQLQLLRERARAFAWDLYEDERFRQAASQDPEDRMVYALELGYLAGHAAASAEAKERVAELEAMVTKAQIAVLEGCFPQMHKMFHTNSYPSDAVPKAYIVDKIAALKRELEK
jgi:hypothetical protein